ncbi:MULTISPECIES: TetR/AcrR family transcriptional regulator [unclassified Beijerinckia]|uniref:TetR/AcrR family transcriptional regulator n=1 Tax=unclassified Beijerinckia TaxID=2638183 RepID=UPI001FCD0EA7|nr:MULTISPECIES: TetR/AcrR family transcriptional regulator [unclassified Beijerinckia]
MLPAEVRIDGLLSAAADLFVSKGIEATTVDDIVARAGVAKGTFYHYFPTKADVILALRERFSRDFTERVASAIAVCPPDDHAARITAWLSGAVATYLANYELHDVVFHDFTHSRRQSQEKDVVLAQLIALFQDGEKAGAWTLPNARMTALVFFDGMHGAVDDAIAAGGRDPQPIIDQLSTLFTRMLRT